MILNKKNKIDSYISVKLNLASINFKKIKTIRMTH